MSILSFAIELLLPPVSLAWLALLALMLPRRRRMVRSRLPVLLFLVPLVLFSIPVVSQALFWSLSLPQVDEGQVGEAPGAIVILSAETERVPGPERLDIGPLTLERERAGAAVYRRTGLPVLVTGGLVNGSPPVAVLMAQSMSEDFQVPVRFVEPRSATTWENARFSASILKQAGITRVYLVTHGWHMRRSLVAFRRAGLEVVPAPVRQEMPPTFEYSDLAPRLSAWLRSYYAMHEWVGLAYYTWRRG